MIDNGKPFDMAKLRQTMPWRPTLQRGGKIVMIDRFGREVDMVDMVNFVETTTEKIATNKQSA